MKTLMPLRIKKTTSDVEYTIYSFLPPCLSDTKTGEQDASLRALAGCACHRDDRLRDARVCGSWDMDGDSVVSYSEYNGIELTAPQVPLGRSRSVHSEHACRQRIQS